MSQHESNHATEQFDITNKPTGIKRLVKATQNSARAISWLAKNEAAFRQELLLLAAAVVVVAVWQVSLYESAALLVSVLLILLMEIINTAIEATIDRISLNLHPLAGLAKDLGSAAVLVTMLIAGIVWGSVILSHTLLG